MSKKLKAKIKINCIYFSIAVKQITLKLVTKNKTVHSYVGQKSGMVWLDSLLWVLLA